MKSLILQKVERDANGRLKINEIKYNTKDISNIRFGKFKDFCSEDDIFGNGVNPNDAAINITFYPKDSSDEGSEAILSGDWEFTFE